jgi:hypothetical protein
MRVRKSATALWCEHGENMGALAEASASDEAANNAGRVSPKLVSCVLRRNGGFVRVAIEAWIEATPLRIDRGALRY